MSTRNFPGDKVRPAREAENVGASISHNPMAFTACYRDSFIFFYPLKIDVFCHCTQWRKNMKLNSLNRPIHNTFFKYQVNLSYRQLNPLASYLIGSTQSTDLNLSERRYMITFRHTTYIISHFADWGDMLRHICVIFTVSFI
jgi:hypothetical protein